MKILGQDIDVVYNQLRALYLNLLAWAGSKVFTQRRILSGSQESNSAQNMAISIQSPGGFDHLQLVDLQDKATVGYNVPIFKKGTIFVDISNANRSSWPQDLVIIRVHYFSINYADIAIRWGLYESALRYVGWPIVPGFDLSGVVEWAGSESEFQAGDEVFGFTMFGGYSTKVIVPSKQIRKLSNKMSIRQGAALPAVAATALHALSLGGGWPLKPISANKAVMIHSAAGGVGSMLIQMCKVSGYYPIVAVVGSASKAEYCRTLGADHVIVKETSDLWKEAEKISPDGFAAIFDANGVETLKMSYSHLSRCGRLVTYGFHSNLPKSGFLSPMAWIRLIYGLFVMPTFDPMNELELIDTYMKQILEWVDSGAISPPETTVFAMNQIQEAHQSIQSGLSVGKLLIQAK